MVNIDSLRYDSHEMPKPRRTGLRWIAAVCAIAVALALAHGCDSTIHRSDLDARVAASQGNSFPDTLYYTGSDDTYDYYVIENGLNRSKTSYRVLRAENDQPHRMPRTQAEELWQYVAGLENRPSDRTIEIPGNATSRPIATRP
jgi:hypothetical protein